MGRKVAEELTKVKKRIAAGQIVIFLKQWYGKLEDLLLDRRFDLNKNKLSMLEAGTKLIADYIQRGATTEQMKSLLSSIQHEFNNTLSDLIADKVSSVHNDSFLSSWAIETVKKLHSDELVASSMKEFAAHYHAVVKSITDDLEKGVEKLQICNRVFDKLNKMPNARLYFGLVLNDLHIRFALARCVGNETVEGTSRMLLLVLLFRELAQNNSSERRLSAARTLTKMQLPEGMQFIFARLTGEKHADVAASLRKCLDQMSTDNWYDCFIALDKKAQTMWMSSSDGHHKLKRVLLDILPRRGHSEQKLIVGTLASFADPECLSLILDFLVMCDDKDFRCKLIPTLPAFEIISSSYRY